MTALYLVEMINDDNEEERYPKGFISWKLKLLEAPFGEMYHFKNTTGTTPNLGNMHIKLGTC